MPSLRGQSVNIPRVCTRSLAAEYFTVCAGFGGMRGRVAFDEDSGCGR